jgi:diguanylate cyclase (GGDEF)-like protein
LVDLAAPDAASLFILSFRHRDELLEAASRGGWRALAARRAAGVERRFIASGASIAIVDGRGALDEAVGAIRMLADPVEANAAAMLVLLSRNDGARLNDVFAAGATHFLASPFGEAELLQALRFAARHAQRVGSGAISRPALRQEDVLSWSFGRNGLELSAALRSRFGLGEGPIGARQAYRLLPASARPAARAARGRLRADYGSTAFLHAMPDGNRVVHHLAVGDDGQVTGLIEPLETGNPLPLQRDALTGLPDAAAARRWLSAQLAEGSRPGVLLIGLNRLTTINSLYGRATGDALLQAASRRIDVAARDVSRHAWLGRLAGTEFVVGLPGATPEQMNDAADRITHAVGRRYAGSPELAATIGGAIAHDDEDAGALLRRASAALAEARDLPGHAVLLGGSDEAGIVERNQRLAEELRRAMGAGQIDVLFQPQVRMSDGHIDGVEALARWHHPEFGELGATALFGAAERAELVESLSELVQQRAFQAAAAWPDALAALRLSVNVMATDLARPDFAARMLAAIDASGFARSRVTLEVTEEGLIEDLAAAASALAALRQGGCRVAVDDFGTGYSSLAYLKALPLDYLKLDRRLSQDIAGSARDRIVVRGVIDMARSLGLGVVAEGVETEEQLGLLAAEGCTLYQGFLFSGPVTGEELARLATSPASRR